MQKVEYYIPSPSGNEKLPYGSREYVVQKETGDLLKITDDGDFIIKASNGFVRTINNKSPYGMFLKIIDSE